MNYHKQNPIQDLVPSLVEQVWDANPILHDTILGNSNWSWARQKYCPECWHIISGAISQFSPQDIAFFITTQQTEKSNMIQECNSITKRLFDLTNKHINFQWVTSTETIYWIKSKLYTL